MKRVLIVVLALSLLVLGAAVTTAQIEQSAIITPVNRVYAAWQPFENGVMMWWSDLDQIWVFINPTSTTSGQAYIFEDTWNGEALPVWAPPLGRYAPVRGFGKVWSFLGGSTSLNQLGWALAPEIGYDSAARIVSGSEWIIQGPGETRYGVAFIPTAQNAVYFGVGSYRVIRIG